MERGVGRFDENVQRYQYPSFDLSDWALLSEPNCTNKRSTTTRFFQKRGAAVDEAYSDCLFVTLERGGHVGHCLPMNAHISQTAPTNACQTKGCHPSQAYINQFRLRNQVETFSIRRLPDSANSQYGRPFRTTNWVQDSHCGSNLCSKPDAEAYRKRAASWAECPLRFPGLLRSRPYSRSRIHDFTAGRAPSGGAGACVAGALGHVPRAGVRYVGLLTSYLDPRSTARHAACPNMY